MSEERPLGSVGLGADNNGEVSNTAIPRIAIVILLLGLTPTPIAGQTTDFTLRRYGSVALTDDDVGQITTLATKTGQRPWLMHSAQTMVGNLRIAEVFLEPDLLGARG